MSPFCTTRNAILVLIFSTEKPGLSFSTTKPLTSPDASSRAQMTFMSEKVELPIHFFWPLRIQVSPSRRQVVSIPPDVAEPTSGSVHPKEPTFAPADVRGPRAWSVAPVTARVDGPRREASVNPPEGSDGGVDARHLHSDEAVEQPATAGGAVALVPDPCDIDVERAQLGNDLVRELVPGPIVLDDRCDFGLHEIAYALDNRPLLRIEQVGNLVEIAVDGRRRIFLLAHTSSRHGRHVILH